MCGWTPLVALVWTLQPACSGGSHKTNETSTEEPVADADSEQDSRGDSVEGGNETGEDCQHGIPLEINAYVRGTIDAPGRPNFYTLRVTMEELIQKKDRFLRVYTSTMDRETWDTLDTVLTVYDENENKVATNDDAVPRLTADSELFIHTPTDATYCVKVEDYSTWSGDEPRGSPTFTYQLVAETLSDGLAGNNRDREPNEDATHATRQSYSKQEDGTLSGYVYGLFDTVTDTDVYRFTLPKDVVRVGVYMTPTGLGGFGTTIAPGMVRITDAQGMTVAQVDGRKSPKGISLPLLGMTEGYLWIQRPEGAPAGANDFYFFKQVGYKKDDPSELETVPGKNDTMASAESITPTADWTIWDPASSDDPESEEKVLVAYILGYVDSISDVDYYRVQLKAGGLFQMTCGAARLGSGLVGASFVLTSGTGQTLQNETEVDTADVIWSDSKFVVPSKPGVRVATDGEHYLRVSAAGQSAAVSSKFYRCGVFVSD